MAVKSNDAMTMGQWVTLIADSFGLQNYLEEKGVIQGGMIPKLENSFSAIDAGVSQVVITLASAIHQQGGTVIKK